MAARLNSAEWIVSILTESYCTMLGNFSQLWQETSSEQDQGQGGEVLRGAAGGDKTQGQGGPQGDRAGPGARKAPIAGGRDSRPGAWVPCVGTGSPRHLQVKHEGEVLQVAGFLRLEGVSPLKILGSRGEVTELDVGLGL